MTKKEALTLINKAWTELDYALQNIHWGNYGKEYLQLNIEEEKGHDRMRPDHIQRGLTIREAAKLFAVNQVADYLLGERKLEVKDYLNCRKSCFFAYALAANYEKEIREAWRNIDIKELCKLDYAELVK